MQLTSAYQHRAQHGSGVLAGTQEEADRYWDNPNSARDTNEYWRIFYLPPGEASSSSNQDETARSGEASSSNDTGLSGEKRQEIRSLLLSNSNHRNRDSKNFANNIEDVSEAQRCLNYLQGLKGDEFSNLANSTFYTRKAALSRDIMTRWHIQ
jgi:hypothetical protein